MRDKLLRHKCPFHERCCQDWGITKPHNDICAYERWDELDDCPSLVASANGEEYAYIKIAPDDPG